jgi:hypothetical protein
LALGDGVRLITRTDQVIALVKYAREEAAAVSAAEDAAAPATEESKETK